VISPATGTTTSTTIEEWTSLAGQAWVAVVDQDRLIEIAGDLRVIAGMMMEDAAPLAVGANRVATENMRVTYRLRDEAKVINILLEAEAALLQRTGERKPIV
jgi:hypothetical protein